MTPNNVRYAIALAQRFIDAANAAMTRQAADDEAFRNRFPDMGPRYQPPTVGPSRESGAARRASMDLTRALAAMRRPS